MERFKKNGLKVLGALALLLRIATSWRIVLCAAFVLPFLLGEPVIFCIIFSIVCSYVSYRIWKDYDAEEDGQITMEEFRKKEDIELEDDESDS